MVLFLYFIENLDYSLGKSTALQFSVLFYFS